LPNGYAVAEALESRQFTVHLPFGELANKHAQARAYGPHSQTDGCSSFSFSIARIHVNKATFS